jgi:hypothetical protein
MRFGKQIEDGKTVINKTFAFLPLPVNGQWVWLEFIYEVGYYRRVPHVGRYIWISNGFVVGKNPEGLV